MRSLSIPERRQLNEAGEMPGDRPWSLPRGGESTRFKLTSYTEFQEIHDIPLGGQSLRSTFGLAKAADV